MNQPTKDEIDAHLLECKEGAECPFRRAREVLERPEAPTREELSELLIRIHFAEEYMKELHSADETKARWLAAILDRGEAGEVLLTDAELVRQRDALIVVSPEDGGTLLKLDDATRAKIRAASGN